MITLIFFAEALLIVETMSNSYTKFSLTGGQVDWIMKTFLDLTLSMTSILHYPSLNLPTLMLPRSICRMSDFVWESSLLELPEKMTMSFLKLIPTLPKLFSEFEWDILPVVKFSFQLLLQFLIDSLVFFLVHPVGCGVDHKERAQKPQSTRGEDLGERSEHLINNTGSKYNKI